MSSYYAEKFSKTLTQVLSYVVCFHSRRHVQKENTEKDIRKKSKDVLCLRKTSFPVLFALGPGFITPYSLGVYI